MYIVLFSNKTGNTLSQACFIGSKITAIKFKMETRT